MLVLPAIMENITTRRDKTWKLTIGTQELTPEQAGEVVKLNQEYCYLAIKKDAFKTKELDIISGLESEMEFSFKPHSQRLKAVLFLMWKQDNEGYKDSELHYRFHMERVIDHFKGRLP